MGQVFANARRRATRKVEPETQIFKQHDFKPHIVFQPIRRRPRPHRVQQPIERLEHARVRFALRQRCRGNRRRRRPTPKASCRLRRIAPPAPPQARRVAAQLLIEPRPPMHGQPHSRAQARLWSASTTPRAPAPDAARAAASAPPGSRRSPRTAAAPGRSRRHSTPWRKQSPASWRVKRFAWDTSATAHG